VYAQTGLVSELIEAKFGRQAGWEGEKNFDFLVKYACLCADMLIK
jgi:hypothetical protein